MCYAINESTGWQASPNTDAGAINSIGPAQDARPASTTDKKEDAPVKRPADEVLQHEVTKVTKLSHSEEGALAADGAENKTITRAKSAQQITKKGPAEKAEGPGVDRASSTPKGVAGKSTPSSKLETPKKMQSVVATGSATTKKKTTAPAVMVDDDDGEDEDEEDDGSEGDEDEHKSEDDAASTTQTKSRKTDIVKAEARARKAVREKMQAEKNKKINELNKKHRKEMSDLKKKMEALKTKHEEQMKDKDDKHKTKIDELKLRAEEAEEDCKTTKTELNEALRDAKAEYTTTLRTTKAGHTKAMRDIKVQHAHAIKELKPDFSEAMRLKDELLRDKNKDITRLVSAQRKMEENVEYFEKTMSHSAKEVQLLDAKMKRTLGQVKLLGEEIEERERKTEAERAEAHSRLEEAAKRFEIQKTKARNVEYALVQMQRGEFSRGKAMEMRLREMEMLKKKIAALEKENAGLKAEKEEVVGERRAVEVKEEEVDAAGQVQPCGEDSKAESLGLGASGKEELDTVVPVDDTLLKEAWSAVFNEQSAVSNKEK